MFIQRLQELPICNLPVLPQERTVPLHSMVVSIGHSRETTQQYDWDGLQRGKGSMVIFQYTLDGYGMLRYEEQTYKVERGQAMVLHIPHNHRYWLPEDSRMWDFIYITLEGSEIMRMFRAIEQRCVPLFNINGNSHIFSTFLNIYQFAQKNDQKSAFRFSIFAYEFTSGLLDELKPILWPAEEPAFLAKAKDYIDKNLFRKTSLDEIAQVSGYSKFHFCRLFKEHEGISVKKYEEHARMKKAASLLVANDDCIKYIAYEVGFKDVSNFCRIFKSYFRMTPTEYRQRGI